MSLYLFCVCGCVPGDTLVGTSVWGLCSGYSMEMALKLGTVAASMSTECQEAVPPTLTARAVEDTLRSF